MFTVDNGPTDGPFGGLAKTGMEVHGHLVAGTFLFITGSALLVLATCRKHPKPLTNSRQRHPPGHQVTPR